ncbi:MAG: VOC family protein [Acidimicrobiia bacterium]|nr:VOC family protein [Acidimicrobiia bacterium]
MTDTNTSQSPEASANIPPVGWLRGVIVDAVDPERLATFWAGILGVEVAEQVPGWLQLRFGSQGSLIAFQPVEAADHKPIRIRIDVEVEDLEKATDGVVALGGELLEIVRFRPGEEHRLMADPEGNEFNLVMPFPPGLQVR